MALGFPHPHQDSNPKITKIQHWQGTCKRSKALKIKNRKCLSQQHMRDNKNRDFMTQVPSNNCPILKNYPLMSFTQKRLATALL